jgi:hypothetical protein
MLYDIMFAVLVIVLQKTIFCTIYMYLDLPYNIYSKELNSTFELFISQYEQIWIGGKLCNSQKIYLQSKSFHTYYEQLKSAVQFLYLYSFSEYILSNICFYVIKQFVKNVFS